MSQRIDSRHPAAAPARSAATKGAAPAQKTHAPAQNTAAKLPQPAPQAKAFVDAFAHASKAMTQMDMVAGSQQINHAADGLLKATAQQLAQQLEMRGQNGKAKAVLADTDKLLKQLGQPKGYYVDPDRGSMAALEDNGDRQAKVMAKLAELAGQLEKVNAKPIGDSQMAMNMSAYGDQVAKEAKFAVAFEKAYDKNGSEAVIKEAQTFFAKLPKRVDSQIDAKGGSLEPLERADATAQALEQMSKKFAATGAGK